MVDKTRRKKKQNSENLFRRLITGEKKSMINGFESVVTDGKSVGINARNGDNALSRTNPAISFDV